jgi:hypothetical protein
MYNYKYQTFRQTSFSLGLCKSQNSYKYPVWLSLAPFCEGLGALFHRAFSRPMKSKNLGVFLSIFP